MLAVFALMAVGLIFRGRPFVRGCGGTGKESDCNLCEGGKKPDNCPNAPG